MDKEKLIQILWKNNHLSNKKCPRNHVAISCGMKEAMLDMRTFRYSDPVRYRKALKIYNAYCKEREERNIMEDLADKILQHGKEEQKPEIYP